MIHSLKIKNFYSFKNETILTFEEDNETRYKNVFFLLGHNASGKTTFLKSISFLKWFILYSFRDSEPKGSLPFDPYYFSKKQKPTELEVIFSCGEKTYKYAVELTEGRVLNEQLWIQNKKERTTFSTLFSKKWDSSKKTYDLVTRNFALNESKLSNRENCSILSVARYLEQHDSKHIFMFWENVGANISYMGKFRNDEFDDILNVSKTYYEDKELKDEVIELMKKFEIGISGVDILEREREGKDNKYYYAMLLHKRADSDSTYPLPIFLESSGTKSLFVILKDIVRTLKNGGVAVLDEVDGELHPLLTEKIIDLFLSKKHNKKNAQLILSTHNAYLINLVSKEQIILVEKNENLESEAFKVSDIKGVRNDENFASKYLAGAYGAVMKG